ncbi:class IIb bacteriocin, lactobin A/cerein 7B family [Echinicola shivajiensis]|uniref:class IIb bacteriocin, lactobin A/cerein 7B family n=1 Tax=Echinicola shivajiensis TaxID=1035916 RepID=UPI001BFCD39E|nr:class IIb bacteriocin, lactobin A/cerein 7B family [Echinicola shivajiensis]
MENMRELKQSELKSINGGFGFLVKVAAGIIIGGAVAIINDWDNFKAGLKGEEEVK